MFNQILTTLINLVIFLYKIEWILDFNLEKLDYYTHTYICFDCDNYVVYNDELRRYLFILKFIFLEISKQLIYENEFDWKTVKDQRKQLKDNTREEILERFNLK